MTAMATATDVEQIVDRYLAAWNETDVAARRALIARTAELAVGDVGEQVRPGRPGQGRDHGRAGVGEAQPAIARRIPAVQLAAPLVLAAEHHDRAAQRVGERRAVLLGELAPGRALG